MIDWPHIRRLARDRFGIQALRPGQRELIDAVLSGRDAIGVLPTGAGKSLTYQLPALILPGPVVVVSPLIALMQDQQEKLAENDINAARLNSSLTAAEERDALAGIRAGEIPLIYVTPERLENQEYLQLLKQQRVSLFVVDEAHCVSQWGHDFRPAYLSLRDAIRELGRPPVLALTATATPDVIDDVAAQLDMRAPLRVNTGVARDNLVLEVFRTPSLDSKHDRILSLLRSQPGNGIIYAATIRLVEELYRWLTAHEFQVGRYHGKRKPSEREDTQRSFMEGKLPIMIATNAFGLGVDKPDIRFIIHYNFPDSLESYYQEAGRAGRDGKPARIILLYKLEDKRVQSYFLCGKYPRREESTRVFECLTQAGQTTTVPVLAQLADVSERRCKVIVAYLEHAEVLRRSRNRVQVVQQLNDREALDALLDAYENRHRDDRERLESMMHYAQSAQCRMRILQEYFGDVGAEDCERCDNCLAHARGLAAAGIAQPLSAVRPA